MSKRLAELAKSFTPLTSVRNVVDLDIPDAVDLGRHEGLRLPESMRRKDIHYTIEEGGKRALRAAWIAEPLAHLINAHRAVPGGELFRKLGAEKAFNVRLSELQHAREGVRSLVVRLIKERVLRDRSGPGAMAFVQANENVPKDAVLVTRRTHDSLCAYDYRWRNCSTVMAVRFPNLGPGTTQHLHYLVNGRETQSTKFKPKDTFYSVGSRLKGAETLASLLGMMEGDETPVEPATNSEAVQIMDSFYLHPDTLKGGFEGDGDGDQLFIVIEERGKAHFKPINLTREPGERKEELVEQLFKKARRAQRGDLASYLPNYFDDVPIAAATYAIRWWLWKLAKQYADQGSDHPMADAWEELGRIAIEVIETVMDIRKVDKPESEIEEVLARIRQATDEIKAAKEQGNWCARVVTSSSIEDAEAFLEAFPTIADFVCEVTHQKRTLTLEDL